MAIETKCPGCQRTLRVGNEHAGKQARCPMCNTIYVVAGGETSESQPPASKPDDPWYMKTPEGQVFGPVNRAELERWLAEGRISAECELRTRENQEWRPADEYFGVLSTAARPRTEQHPAAGGSGSVQATDNPFRSGDAGAGDFRTQPSFQIPHRGAMVLAFGILGWIFTCPVFAVMAWVMGTSDLREMRCGRMDSGGMGLTQAGHILGMIYTLLWLAVCVIAIFVTLFAVLAQSFA
jgi:hypothetical protein